MNGNDTDKKKPWLYKSPSQLTPEERLKAYEATGVKITRMGNHGTINNPKKIKER